MGEVCLAEDTRLNRKVALKLLPSEFTQNSERLRRFELEAKTASGLNHPNIITIYDIGEAHNTHFIATEFIEGQTLRDRLRQPLSLNESLDIALQIANALAAAHEANIIHRDIKPENVMLRGDGIVKVLDFGLAKLSETRSAEFGVRSNEDDETLMQPATETPQSALHTPQSTLPGTVMGTASYMSPEQARGLRVDARTDIFSLGVVLYEMLAGKRPFDGVNMIDVLGAIMHETPAPLPDAPAEVNRIVTKALNKDREQRYQTTQELVRDLKELKEELAYQARVLGAQPDVAQAARLRMASAAMPSTLASQSTEEKTISSPNKRATSHALAARKLRALPVMALLALALIAVAGYVLFNRKVTPALAEREPLLLTDFENKTGEDIWDGTLKQALAVALEQSPYMNIFPEERARDTLRLMNRSVDEPITRATGREICQRRNVRALLVGTITKLERSYTVTLEATNAQSGETIARTLETAEGKDKVVEALGRAAKDLRGKLGESLATLQKYDKPLLEMTTSSLDALKAYSEGRERIRKGRLEEQIPFYQRAIELDPRFAVAWLSLGSGHFDIGNPSMGLKFVGQAYQMRDRTSEREKLQIASFYFRENVGDLNKVNELTSLWVNLYPQDALGFYQVGQLALQAGQYEKAMEAYREAIRIDPDYTIAYQTVASVLLRLNRYDEATEVIRQAQARKLDMWSLHGIRYLTAFVRNEANVMSHEVEWFSGKPDAYRIPEYQARAAAFGGRLRQAHDFWQQASALAESRNLPVETPGMQAWEAEIKAHFGFPQPVITQAAQALALLRSRKAEIIWRRGNLSYPLTGQLLALTFALSGDTARAQVLADELAQKLPEHTLNNGVWLPTIRAAIELQRNQPDKAIQLLEAARQYDAAYTIHFRSTWIRGQAYLQLKQGAQAAAEFQKIIDHRGWDVTSPLWPLAHLGLARAMLLQGDTVKAKQSYNEFFRLWKDADADLPVLIEAKKEYEKLK